MLNHEVRDTESTVETIDVEDVYQDAFNEYVAEADHYELISQVLERRIASFELSYVPSVGAPTVQISSHSPISLCATEATRARESRTNSRTYWRHHTNFAPIMLLG
jgi:hypothetical protein